MNQKAQTGLIIGILIAIVAIIGVVIYVSNSNKGVTGNVVNEEAIDTKIEKNIFNLDKVEVDLTSPDYIELNRYITVNGKGPGGPRQAQSFIEITNNNDETIYVEYYCDTELNHIDTSYVDDIEWIYQCSPNIILPISTSLRLVA